MLHVLTILGCCFPGGTVFRDLECSYCLWEKGPTSCLQELLQGILAGASWNSPIWNSMSPSLCTALEIVGQGTGSTVERLHQIMTKTLLRDGRDIVTEPRHDEGQYQKELATAYDKDAVKQETTKI
jgi:hypothetical protein